ncbi:MAG: hypothetical protein J6J25_04515 [Bacteroidales bacterium]|nr:hypothetical protein [Bacteroidales bacterium]
MKLFTERGTFALPSDFSFEIERTNPIFSDEGSGTLPFTLPPTKDNLLVADNPEALARKYAIENDYECVLQHGDYQVRGRLVVSSVSKEGISGSIILFESGLYKEYKDASLKNIFGTDVYIYNSTVDTLCQLLQHNNESTISKPEDDDYRPEELAVFPVVGMFAETYRLWLNGRIDISDEGGISYGDFEYAARSIKVGEDTYNVPKGYGITAFPYLAYILEELFKRMYYTVVRNDFRKQPFYNIVLINNVADAICAGKLYYKDMVPDMNVSDFLEWLYNKFGAVVTVSGKEVSIVILACVLDSPFDIDLTEFADDDESISIPEVSSVSISLDTSLDTAEPVDDTYDNAVHTVGNFTTVANYNLVKDTGIYYYVQNLGKFYYKGTDGTIKITSEAFNFNGGYSWNIQTESLKTDDLYTPMYPLNNYKPSKATPFVGPVTHYHTAIKDSEEEEEINHPLMICWAYYSGGLRCGTVCGYDANGNRLTYGPDDLPLPALSPTGLYTLCWQKYNDMLVNTAQEISVTVHLPYSMLKDLDLSIPKRYKGHKVLIKSISYTLSDAGVAYGQAKLQLIPEYVYSFNKTPYFPY